METNIETKHIMRLRAIVIATIITASFIVLSLSGMAAEPNKETAPKTAAMLNREKVKAEISRNIPFPTFVTSNSAANEVRAIVDVDSNGLVNVQDISTANPEMKNYITKQLNNMQLENRIPTGPFVLVLKFRVL